MVAKIPDNVSFGEASFTVVGAIGLQGIRLVNPNYGETVVVIGLGLIGIITCQILLSNGCKVLGFDNNSEKINLAKKLGIECFLSKSNSCEIVFEKTKSIGADSVIITASTKSSEVISQSAQMCRKREKLYLLV